MDYVFLSLGSNVGENNLENAVLKLIENGIKIVKISPVYKTPALMLKNSPTEWNIPYLNCVLKVKTDEKPEDLLIICKKIEKQLYRDFSKKWSPRPIDIDILMYKNQKINTDNLTIPHKEMNNRSFVLDPLSFLYKVDNRYIEGHQPAFMGIINITPDSFSDGGLNNNFDNFKKTFDNWRRNFVQIVDIGAESTRPGAIPIDYKEELERLKKVFLYLKNKEIFNPLLSIDTYHYKTAIEAINNGFDIVNDVSGLNDINMLNIAKDNNNINFVFMHNLGVPSDKNIFVKGDIINEIKIWLEEKINIFDKMNIDKDRLFFDPGIGFGKTASQDLQILQNLSEFHKYGFKILIGHSRKSFIKTFSNNNYRDLETLSISLNISKYVDIIRVHTPLEHQRAILAYNHCFNQFI